jgi:hypothetical protein
LAKQQLELRGDTRRHVSGRRDRYDVFGAELQRRADEADDVGVGHLLLAGAGLLELDLAQLFVELLAAGMAQCGAKPKDRAEHGHRIVCPLDAFGAYDLVSVGIFMDRRLAPLFVPVFDVKYREIADEAPPHGGFDHLEARDVSRAGVVLDPVKARMRVFLVNAARRAHRAVIRRDREGRFGHRFRGRYPGEQASGVVLAKVGKHLVVSASG